MSRLRGDCNRRWHAFPDSLGLPMSIVEKYITTVRCIGVIIVLT